MRRKVESLLSLFRHLCLNSNGKKEKVTYNVVCLPGESFKFETHLLEKKEGHENMLLFMYENKKKIWEKWKDAAKELVDRGTEVGGGFCQYIRAHLPPISAFASLRAFLWYDFCGTPTRDRIELLRGKMHRNSVLVVTFANQFRQRQSIAPEIITQGTETYVKEILFSNDEKMHHLFTEEYSSENANGDLRGTPMIMMAFTNSKSLASVWRNNKSFELDKSKRWARKKRGWKVAEGINETPKGNHFVKSSDEIKTVFQKVILMLDKNKSDKSIMRKFSLTKNQLAGYKANRTRRLNRE